MNLEVVYGGTVPSGIQVNDGTVAWETLAPAAGLTEQVPAKVTLDITVAAESFIEAGRAFYSAAFPLEIYTLCNAVDNPTAVSAVLSVEAVSVDTTLNVVTPFFVWSPVVFLSAFVSATNLAASQNSEAPLEVLVPCKPITDDLQFSNANTVTTIVTAHADLLSVNNPTDSVQGVASNIGEWDYKTGLIDGVDAIAQQLRIRLNFQLGSWFLDTRQGIPYLTRVLIKAPDSASIKAIIRRTVLTTPGVVDVENIELNLTDERQLEVSFTAYTTQSDDPLVFNREFVVGSI